jgi:hypothetical protein
MANRQTTFLLKRSNVPGKIPSSSGLTLGELALNTADAILYTSGTTSNNILPIGWDRIHRTGDTVTGDFVFNGNIDVTGNTIVSGTISGGTMVITTQPTSGYTTTQILMRNSTTGQVEITDRTSPSIYNYGMTYVMTTFNYLT